MQTNLIIFFFIVLTAILHLWVVIEISRFPTRFHRNKRKWTNVVLFYPFFGIIAYFFIGRKAFKE